MQFKYVPTFEVNIPEEKIDYAVKALREAEHNHGYLKSPLQIGKNPHIFCLGDDWARTVVYRARTVAYELIKAYSNYGENKKWPIQFTTMVQKELLARFKKLEAQAAGP